MKKTVLLTAVVAAALCAHSATLSLDGTWEFSKNGGAFEKVTVPHDWAIAGPFNPEAPCGSGKLPWQGYGEYRRTFTAARAEKAATEPAAARRSAQAVRFGWTRRASRRK